MISYAYVEGVGIDNIVKLQKRYKTKMRFMLDSGAFTAFNTGKPIKIQDYCNFIKNTPIKLDNYIALDVIQNAKETKKNYYKMLECGLRPMPVFTSGADIKDIDEYYSTSDYILVGGLVGVGKNSVIRRIAEIMEVIDGRKVHLLGFSQMKWVNKFRPYSIDSSSWLSGIRYGQVNILTDNPLMLSAATRKDFIKKPDKKLVKALHRVGVSAASLRKSNSWNSEGYSSTKKPLMTATARARVYQAIEIEKKVGTKVYFALASTSGLEALVDAYEYLNERGVKL